MWLLLCPFEFNLYPHGSTIPHDSLNGQGWRGSGEAVQRQGFARCHGNHELVLRPQEVASADNKNRWMSPSEKVNKPNGEFRRVTEWRGNKWMDKRGGRKGEFFSLERALALCFPQDAGWQNGSLRDGCSTWTYHQVKHKAKGTQTLRFEAGGNPKTKGEVEEAILITCHKNFKRRGNVAWNKQAKKVKCPQ